MTFYLDRVMTDDIFWHRIKSIVHVLISHECLSTVHEICMQTGFLFPDYHAAEVVVSKREILDVEWLMRMLHICTNFINTYHVGLESIESYTKRFPTNDWSYQVLVCIQISTNLVRPMMFVSWHICFEACFEILQRLSLYKVLYSPRTFGPQLVYDSPSRNDATRHSLGQTHQYLDFSCSKSWQIEENITVIHNTMVQPHWTL